MRVLIIGVNGFIGSNLTQRILKATEWEVFGMDINTHYLNEVMEHPRFHFTEGDISINNEWIEYHIKKCDVVLPFVAIAQPKLYVTEPLRVFELDFEQNLKIVRWVQKYGRRLVFPSTSEVYGLCDDAEFNEETSNFVYGPINKPRWIYACSKQLLDRVIFAYGRDQGLRYTCIRPFNWIGPRLDTLESARFGNSRVLTQFITNLVDGKPIQLVDGGKQKRCFTDIEDALDCLMGILLDEKKCEKRIFNIGSPENVCSVAALAQLARVSFAEITRVDLSKIPEPQLVTSGEFYGEGFQDIVHRRPDISLARKLLGWTPAITVDVSVRKAVNYFVKHASTKADALVNPAESAEAQ